jgi:hypothetical protein
MAHLGRPLRSGKAPDQLLPTLFTRDARTNRSALSIPLPESVTLERLAGALLALLNKFGPAARAVNAADSQS